MGFNLKLDCHGSDCKDYSPPVKNCSPDIMISYYSTFLRQYYSNLDAALSIFCTVTGLYCYCIFIFITTWGL